MANQNFQTKYTSYAVPGPTFTPSEYLSPYLAFMGSSDVEGEFLTLYDEAEALLKKLFHAPNSTSAVIMTGEGMLALWSGLSSVINPMDRVLSINFGLFGKGIGEMAASKGASIMYLNFEPRIGVTLPDCQKGGKLWTAIHEYRPSLITLVHCETPTGMIVPEDVLNEIGKLSLECGALFYVDMVSSAGGVKIDLSENMVDLALIGSQKCLSLHPDLSIIMVSSRAWERIQAKYDNPLTRYTGYDSLFDFKDPVLNKSSPMRLFPYTMHWNAIQALVLRLHDMFKIGPDTIYQQHFEMSRYVIDRLKSLSFQIFPLDERVSSPTVTAICVPQNILWADLDSFLRNRGVILGGSYGEYTGKVFRIGHMGSQISLALMESVFQTLQAFVELQ